MQYLKASTEKLQGLGYDISNFWKGVEVQARPFCLENSLFKKSRSVFVQNGFLNLAYYF